MINIYHREQTSRINYGNKTYYITNVVNETNKKAQFELKIIYQNDLNTVEPLN